MPSASLILEGANTGQVTLTVSDDAGGATFILPSVDGINGQVLSTDGQGVLNWTTLISGNSANVGTQGYQGYQGYQGHQGYQGAQGRQGVQGATGTQGVQGAAGTGAQGAQGVQGATGAGTQGAQGVQGSTGLQGPIGSGGGLSVIPVSANSGSTITANGVNFVNSASIIVSVQSGIDGNANVILTTTNAAGGAQGVQGAVGAQGATGTQGVQGAVGAQGATGAQGAQGAAGTGTQGAQGVQGATGGGGFTSGTTAPVSPTAGDEWFDTTTGILFKYINDGNSSQWIELSAKQSLVTEAFHPFLLMGA